MGINIKGPSNGTDCINMPRQDNGPNEQRTEEETSDEDTLKVLLKAIMDAFQKLWTCLQLAFSFVMIELGGYKFLDRLIQWSSRNPYSAICIVAGLLIFLLPFLFLLGIGISTLLMTLTGFIVLEGILLSMVATLLLGCVGGLFLAILLVNHLNRAA